MAKYLPRRLGEGALPHGIAETLAHADRADHGADVLLGALASRVDADGNGLGRNPRARGQPVGRIDAMDARDQPGSCHDQPPKMITIVDSLGL